MAYTPYVNPLSNFFGSASKAPSYAPVYNVPSAPSLPSQAAWSTPSTGGSYPVASQKAPSVPTAPSKVSGVPTAQLLPQSASNTILGSLVTDRKASEDVVEAIPTPTKTGSNKVIESVKTFLAALPKKDATLSGYSVLESTAKLVAPGATVPTASDFMPEKIVHGVSDAAAVLNPSNLARVMALNAHDPTLFPLAPGVATAIGMLDLDPSLERSTDQLAIEKAVTAAYEANPDIHAISADFLNAIAGEGGEQKLRTLSLDTETGAGYPETEEEKLVAYKIALDKYNPNGIKNGQNELISKYFPGAIPGIIQKQVDIVEIVNLCNSYDKYLNGYEDTQTTIYDPGEGYFGEIAQVKFSNLSLDQQKDAICKFLKEGAKTGTAPGYTLALIDGLIKSVPDNSRNQQLELYVTNGEVDKDLTTFMGSRSSGDVVAWLKTRDAQLTVGGAFAIAGTVGGFLVAGPAGAIAGAGIAPFATTEFANLFGMDVFRTKADLQAKGLLANDRSIQYDQNYKSSESLVNQLTFNKKDLSPEMRLKVIEQAEAEIERLGNQLGEDAVFLAAIGNYDNELSRYNNLKSTFANQKTMINAKTGEMGSELPAQITITPSTGGTAKVKGYDIKHSGDDAFTITPKDGKPVTVEYYDAKGRLIETETTETYAGLVKNMSPKTDQAFTTLQETQKAAEPSNIRPVTLYVAPGQTAERMGKIYTGGKEGTSYLIQEPAGTQAAITFSQPGKTSKVLHQMVADESTQFWYQALDDAYVSKEKATMSTLAPNIREGQTLIINGKEIVNAERLALLDVTPGLQTIVIKEKGKEDYKTTINAFAGEKIAVAGEGKEPFVPYTGSGSSGGGGSGGSGGSYGGSSAPQTMIKFGVSLDGARTWLDQVEIFPVVGTSYATTAGYHAFKASKSGYKDYEKQIYAMDGQTLSVDVVWVAGSGTGSGSTGTNIIFGTTFTGARVWLDGVEVSPEIGKAYSVVAGYHSVKATKSGFDDWSKEPFIGADSTISVDADWIASGSSGSSTSKPHVIFGAASIGAIVYIDDVRTDVVIGTSYELTEGYHGFRLTKTNYQDWIKTVLFRNGDNLTVSPAFEPLPVETYTSPTITPETSQRVFINSDVVSAKILINGGFTGQWTPAYVDLPRGVYKLTCQKTGYEDYNDIIYVGDVIAFGSTAIALAQISNMEVPL